tara:strand:+ start:67727 stop:70033 length:2307 start_codon:yes stop_codon:yes gene_type:complete
MSLLKDLHSSFWMDDDGWDDSFLVDNSNQERKGGLDYGQLIKLSARRRAIANFVSILTGENIPVEFSSRAGENYTDGKKVVISADAKNETFDSDVGLALHEASHILLSQFEVLERIIGTSESHYKEDRFPILRDDFVTKNDAEEKLLKFIQSVVENEDIKNQLNQLGRLKFQRQMLLFTKDMWNWVEDRRIDHYVFTNAPGYREYYIALYDKYFRTKEISKALESDEYKEETLASYSMRVVNLLNESRDLDALKGLRDIIDVLDLNNVSRLQSSYDALSVAVDVSEIIFNNIDWNQQMEETKNGEPSEGDSDTNFNNNDFNDPPESDDKSSDSGDSDGNESNDGNKSDEDGNESDSSSGSESDEDGDENGSSASDDGDENSSENQDGEGEDSDKESDKNMLSKTMKKRVENQLQKQKEFMEGETKKKKASKKDQEAMKAADQSGSEIVQVGKDVVPEDRYTTKARSVDCILVKNLTKELIESSEFPMKTQRYENFSKESVEKGITMGTMLGKKLKIRSEVRELKTMRQRTGRIERRLINELGYGMENVFGHVEISKYKKAMLYISIDASSSMFSGSYAKKDSKWHRTMTATVAMAKAASMIDNLDIRIDFRATKGNFPYVVIAYDSVKDSFAKLRTLFPLLSPCGYTPEGLCFEALGKTFLPATTERDVYFVNISDGQPYFETKGANGFSYSGHDAATHTKKQVDALRKKGILVSSYYVEDNSGSLYRDRYIHAFKRMYGQDAQFINVSNVHEIAKTMNGKFLQKSVN